MNAILRILIVAENVARDRVQEPSVRGVHGLKPAALSRKKVGDHALVFTVGRAGRVVNAVPHS